MRKLFIIFIMVVALQVKAENKCISQQEFHEKLASVEMLLEPKLELQGNIQKLELLFMLRGLIQGEEKLAIDSIDQMTNSHLSLITTQLSLVNKETYQIKFEKWLKETVNLIEKSRSKRKSNFGDSELKKLKDMINN